MTLTEAYNALKATYTNSAWVTSKGANVVLIDGVQANADVDALNELYNATFQATPWTLIFETPAVLLADTATKQNHGRALFTVNVCENPQLARTGDDPTATLDALQSLLAVPLNLPAANRTAGRNLFQLAPSPNRILSFEGVRSGILFHRLTFTILVHVAPEST
ncbi:hypothetical protein [Cerasicoccus arenae]|uniref:Uncharacterized protein n=1 Tax=Cerasicoccus arenae TaxID=424488 RepID=A0A8J3GDJ7_9BACT|nr:hypothetical protein [Cerasicoccus arenae]MBK1858236.1 hypothetical protein [Cerasicoccus arenae]GHC02073.1 hypothetical protein GCM10007047_18230 [Cerasicoccus arenae]